MRRLLEVFFCEWNDSVVYFVKFEINNESQADKNYMPI